MKNVYLLRLEWPESCFRLQSADRRAFERLVRGRGTVRVARTEAAFLRALPEATHVLCWNFDAAWFGRAPHLKVLATPAAGRELLPRDADVPKGVKKVHGAFHGAVMAETVAAFLLAHMRGLFTCSRMNRAGNRWPRTELSPFCRTLAGAKAVVLGYGKIGRAIGAKLEALGVAVTGVRRRNAARLSDFLRDADALVVALPSDTGTDDIVNARLLAKLPRRAVVVNVGRGNAVDERALVAALKKGRLAGAYLDVCKNEPMRASSPLAGKVPNLFVLPHASAFTPDYLMRFFAELEANGMLD